MQKIWLNSYPKNVPQEINPDHFSSIVDLFLQTAAKFRRKKAIHHLGSELTYGQLDKITKRFAAFLQQDLGLKKGDRLGIMFPNTMQFMAVMLSGLRAGLIMVNINPLYTARELEHQINDAGLETIVVLSNFAKTVEAVLPTTKLKHVIVSDIGDLFPLFKSYLINLILKYIKKTIPSKPISQAISLKRALRKGRRLKLQEVEINPQDIAFLQYTGGTTGISKGAMLTHRNILANVEQTYAWMGEANMRAGEEITVAVLPLYHIFSLLVNCFAFMKIGAMSVMIANPKDIAALIKELSKHKFTVFTGVNTLFKALLRHKNFKNLDFSSLKVAIGGGMAVHPNVAELWKQITEVPLLEGYGLTEASPIVCCSPLNQESYSGDVGLPLPSTEVKIIDKESNELAIGERGELCVRGPQVMKGYWNRETETREVLLDDGWLKTGDIAVMDGKGFVKLVDRKKDMIVVSGYNVYPNEIEAVIAQHPGVLEVAVIGEPSDKTGEIIKAVIVRKDPKLDRMEMMSFCRERLTSYKIPRKFEFCDELPKTAVGKILRRALREERFREKNVQ
jgi:long-chain acyl-CoA synthetase